MPVVQCRHFNGYKPCEKSLRCEDSCAHKNIPSINIILIHLGALGSVVRSTALLAPIHRKYPGCRLFWLTDSPAHKLLQGHPLIDEIFSSSEADRLELSGWNFDIALVVDKSRKAAGILSQLNCDQVFGFQMDPHSGAILPASNAAVELWEVGLSNEKKFFQNKKSEAQLVHESLELGPYSQDEYNLPLSSFEQNEALLRRHRWTADSRQPIIGLNTGASPVIQAKKWTVEFQRSLIREWRSQGIKNIVLLGGAEDSERNRLIGEGLSVVQSPTESGLRDGLISVESCDIVVSGDSLGMHLAIARKKYVVAWFGPTCAHEIDLFNRGVKLLTQLECGPCWKRVCEKPVMCYDQVSFTQIKVALDKGINQWQAKQHQPHQILSFKPPSSEIFY